MRRNDSIAAMNIQVADMSIRLEGDESFLETCRILYGAFPRPMVDVTTYFICWRDCRCEWGQEDAWVRETRVSNPARRPAITALLIGRILAAADTSLILLHGNAIRDCSTGRLLLLCGASGSGKSTLSQWLLCLSAGWALAAEDLIVLQTQGCGALHCFPRAATFRGEMTAHNAIPWSGLGSRSEGKSLRPSDHLRTTTGKLELHPVDVVILSRESEKQSGEERQNAQQPEDNGHREGEEAWISSAEGPLLDALRAESLPVESLDDIRDEHRLVFRRPLSTGEREAFARLLDRFGILLFRYGKIGRVGSADATGGFPAEASGRRLPATEGVQRLWRQRIIFTPEAEASRVPEFFHLARALSNATYYEFSPGGTPERSAQALHALLGH